MKIYGDRQSGNCYKVQLMCDLLGLQYQWIDIDILAGDTNNAEFLAKNPLGKIPLLELDDGRCLSESNAIINYLAFGSEYLPDTPYELAKVQQWQFFEQYSHEPFIAVARFINKYLGLPEDKKQEYLAKQVGGHKALKTMEVTLQHNRFLTGAQATAADVCLYAYTHVAHEGGFDLTQYPAIQNWLVNVSGLKGFTAMV
ncbi:glutathione S-transferase family protein [Psychrosphaera sp. F3M07]|uniref:Glutathione S-transferase family protein n=1 Tax=Psychrosphaera aquimarina TaxID=2044854 RepID=A0ABU3QYT8_9GAMM|nr:glutathione S-transferase family protein [Psychrosphaera aquimarina]MBU2918054.1 glutathione S-transferase family protein [Psychrosphaera sp. F3M07]MDU0112582.1 glutathione S-transferase family protein [Psychrosphaera aquimarina]